MTHPPIVRKCEHTPGPWSINGCPEDYMLIEAEAGEDPAVFVARVMRKGQGIECMEAVSNARLIAQAPAMRELLSALVAMDDSAPSHREWIDASASAIDKARAMLAELEPIHESR